MSNAVQAGASLANLIMPLKGGGLLVPNSCVTEVASAGQLVSALSSDCVVGLMRWRSKNIPLVSFEALRDGVMPDTASFRQVAVMNGLTAHEQLPHYAIILASVPHLLSLREVDIQLDDNTDLAEREAVYAQVLVHGQRLIVPNLDAVEAKILHTIGETPTEAASEHTTENNDSLS